MKAGKQEVPRRPLLWLAAGLILTVPPMFKTLAPWIPVCFVAALVAKFWMDRRGMRLRGFVWQAVLSGAVLGGVQLTYHTLRGLEPCLALFLLVTSLKVLEAHTARDFHFQALLGWILCLAGLFISQDLSAGVYATAAFMLILAAVVQFHRGSTSRRPFSGALLTSLGIMLQALPLVIAFFFLFPRTSPFGFDLSHPFSGRTGLSNELKPGSIGNLALSNDVAFRAEFPDGNMPALTNLYWRAAVFTQDNGLEWSNSPTDDLPHPSEHLGAVPIHQRIILQPSGRQWVFALDWPLDAPAGTTMLWGNILRADRTIYNQWRYEVTSYSANREGGLDIPNEMQNCRQLPPNLSSKVSDLAQSWRAQSGNNPRAIVAAGLEYFHKQKFLYTLTPGQYAKEDGLEDFLFRRRSGFCEHYAAAFATLMRAAGIPARVVIGYYGGQFNTLGKYLIVHQSDAHAWCEVWLPGLGWQRADPTAAVAQGQMGTGFVDMRDTAGAGAADPASQLASAWGRQPIFRNIRQAWDAISYEWDSRVANFDNEAQQSLFLDLGWPDTRSLRFFAWLTLAVAALLGALALWAWWRTRVPHDPLRTRYERFCRRVALLGVKREPWEGPSRFAERAAASLPAHADRIRRVAGLYVTLRYAPAYSPGDLKEFRRMARV